MENIQLQQEEQEVLVSIYGNEWKTDLDEPNSYSIKINPNVQFYVWLNDKYPLENPPTYELLAPTLSKPKKNEIALALDSIYLESLGEPVLFQWIERLKDLLAESTEVDNNEEESNEVHDISTNETNLQNNSRNTFAINLSHGPTIVDRKSTFQGHVCEVHSAEDMKAVLQILLENKKIAQATHNIYAYVIKQDNGTLLQDCDDDGETHAGGRLLHLLQILKVTNVLVVVSRWFGGIHLGPDRFRHINNAARQSLLAAGYLKD